MSSRRMGRVRTRSLQYGTCDLVEMRADEVKDSEHLTQSAEAKRHAGNVRRSGPLQSAAHLLLTLWAGCLWTICGLVAPTSFAVLDRSSAGALVGRFFGAAAWLGFAIGVLLIVLTRTSVWPQYRRLTALMATTASAPVVSELVLGPLMHQARIAGETSRFAALHGIGGALFLIACVGAAVLVWKINRGA